CARRYDWFDYW
nr:immunoglobulin heavy chain junction region [Mus musculus]